MRRVKATLLVPQKVRAFAIAQANIEMPLKFWPQNFQPIRNLRLCRFADLCVPYLAPGFVDRAARFAHLVPADDYPLFGAGSAGLRDDTSACGGVQKFRVNEESEFAEETSVGHFPRVAAIEIPYSIEIYINRAT
jgi:hypothetical protein